MAIARVASGAALSELETEAVMRELMEGRATPAQIGGFLIALHMKGETVEEIIGAVRVLRSHATHIEPRSLVVVDTCGTGGDRCGTFNISTAAAFIAAGAGLTVAKHGNRAMSGTVGGADVLEALGVAIELPPAQVAACIDEIGIGFLFAQVFHPAMRHVAGLRRELGVRTIFNLLGPLSNPAGARHQVVGVYAAEWTEPLAHALGRLGARHALAVHGDDGLDEISLAAPTQLSEWHDGTVRTYRVTPEEFGFTRCRHAELEGGNRDTAAAMIRAILGGATGPRADIAVLNAAAAIYVGGLAPSIAAGIDRARESIRSGRARQKLERLIEFSRR
ncbi:MAG TPA: anthranilate phosphoribosyltransferase [Candidatus Margulisiibacteriota bacterium]|nr:anthranilate phosphoribosyltransferase [Candidatus Margulisiibacteriota bacterium]